MTYAERDEILTRKVEVNKKKIRELSAKIENLQKEKAILIRKVQNQETTLMNIQVKVAEERNNCLETLEESLE